VRFIVSGKCGGQSGVPRKFSVFAILVSNDIFPLDKVVIME
jgi:hypothetical protein